MFPTAEPQSLIQLLSHCASRHPNKEAIMAPARLPLTYKDLLTLIKLIHQHLNSLGLGPGSRIASILPNSPEAAVAFLAVSSCAAFAPLNPGSTDTELENCLSDLKPDVLIILSNPDSSARALLAQRLHIPVIELVPELSQEAGSFSLRGETKLPPINTDFASATDVALLLYTSGTTARAKLAPILQQAICQSCISVVKFTGLTEQDCCLNALPLFHTQGLITGILLPLVAGGGCVYVSGFRPETFVGYLQAYDPTWYVAPPTIHQAILEQIKKTPDFHKNPSLRFIRSGSAPLAASSIKELEAIFRVPVIEAYGMTETLYISSNPMPPGIRKQGSVGISCGACKISVIDDTGRNAPPMVEGEIVVHGPTVIKAYVDNEAANEEAFCLQGFRTGDLGYFDEEGYLFITGRVKEIINRGGEKVSPYEVDQVLLAHPAVKEAVTFPVPHPTLGENIAAVVVVNDNGQVEPETLRQFARQKLAEFKVPYRIVISDHLPKGATGKLQRHKMSAYFSEQLAIQESIFNQEHAADNLALTPLQENLLMMWREVLNIDRIGIHDNFFELGGHSLLAMVLCTKIEAKIGRPIAVELIFQFPTVSSLSGALEKQTDIQGKNFNPVITAFHCEGTQPPFFWLHGGKVVPILLEQMDADQPLYLLNHQSMDGNRAKYLTIPEMADYYLQNILQIDSEGPYYLGGYSIGGMIIYEIAHQLCERGKKVALLFLLDPTAISNDKKEQGPPRQNFNLRGEYHKLRRLGYITYFLDKTRPIKTKFQKQLEQIIIQTYFSLGKPLPGQLHWPYLQGVYRLAWLRYQPGQAQNGIEKAVFIHINNRKTDDWTGLFNGKIETYAVDCNHRQLIEAPHAYTWLKILKQIHRKLLASGSHVIKLSSK